MAIDLVHQRQHSHILLDLLPPEELGVVHSLLEVLVVPLSRSLGAALIDEEDLTAKMAAKLDGARTAFRRGEGIAHEEILKEFGLRS